MKTKLIFCLIILWFCHVPSHAQSIANEHLKKMTEDVKTIRKKKASKDILNKTVLNWSANGMPKITLMDEIKRDPGEYHGKGIFKFKLNQLVSYVYGRQNTNMVSKGDYFNSNEKNVHYSAIEKTVMRGHTVTYKITGHAGKQEFVFVSFSLKPELTVSVNGVSAKYLGEGVWTTSLELVKAQDTITLSITLSSNASSTYESFVILNHNPQKP